MNIHPKKAPARSCIEKLQTYNWPGNVRELENVIERALIRSAASGQSPVLTFDEPVKSHDQVSPAMLKTDNEEIDTLDRIVKRHIEATLHVTDGKVKGKNGAAALLGINPSTLRNRMNKLGINYGRQ